MANKEPSLNIDLADKDGIKEKLPEVRRFVESKQGDVDKAERSLVEARRELADWERLLDQLCVLAGVKPREVISKKSGVRPRSKVSIQEQVIQVVNQSRQPLTAMDVALALGPAANRDTVNYSLWKAAKQKAIQRLGQGRYAAQDYEPTLAEALLMQNGEPKK